MYISVYIHIDISHIPIYILHSMKSLHIAEYLYKVTASNSAGSSHSSWMVGVTRDAPPYGVLAPHSAKATSGYSIGKLFGVLLNCCYFTIGCFVVMHFATIVM